MTNKKKGQWGGKRKGAGRPRKHAAELTLPDGVMPIDYLVGVMRGLKFDGARWYEDEEITPPMKMDAAKAASPYLYPKLSNIDSNVAVDASLTVKVVKYSDDAS
jgi:hypothetical protein